ncbi:helix-turn-helix domain-containing protein [Fictibacillus sp. b24]|uniref:winged helix-turn-helix transcriptional regulator n=1 Tax=Fictibacillus sp. b24 TaxID=3055863 RepID=UPI0025A1ABBD|nr:helix-turn-helix domain-containing protein [Fictibacillus sp. b24]MDM5317384.1 helix-turn-helix domain-containing protein [Fictibacillus sp. b24]
MNDTGYKRKEDCPLTFALTLIGSKWRLPIIWALWKNKTLRYNELKRHVDGITNMVLSQSLKEMENQGLVIRKQYMEIPPRVEYSLTKAGEDLVPSLKSLAKWGKRMQGKVKNDV